MTLDQDIEAFKNKEVQDLLAYANLDVYQNILEKYDSVDEFRVEEIEFDPEILDGVSDDIGYFTDTICGEKILDYMLKHFNETEIDDELENVSIDNKSYTVNELKEIFADNPCENDATYIISMVLYDTLIGRNELDKSGYPLRSEILAEYSYQVCKKLGLSDEEIFA